MIPQAGSYRGILAALAAALLFGASTPFAKLVLAEASPILVAGLLYLGSGAGLAILRIFRASGSNRPKETPVSRQDLPWLAGAILAGGVIAPVLLLFGLVSTPASSASLLLNLEAVATASIAWVVFRENVDRRIFFGFVLIFLGGLLLSLPHGQRLQFSSGALLISGACLAWGIDNNLTRKISGSDPFQIVMWKGLVAGLVNTGVAFIFLGAKLPSLSVWGGALIIGFFGYGLSLVFFVLALRDLGTARTSAYFSLAPFVGAALSFTLGEGVLDGMFLVAGVLMLIGVWLHMTERHEHPHEHDPMEHEHLHVHDDHHQHVHLPDDPQGEPHAHRHRHPRLIHSHPHYPDLHHQHRH